MTRVIHTNLQLHLYEILHDLYDFFLLRLKRAPETQNHTGPVPEHQGTGYFMRSECMKLVLVSFTLMLSAAAACALVNVCAGYMCFVKL